MSATILINHQEFRNAGLNREAPIETTTDMSSYNYALGLTDRLFFNAATLLESTVQLSAEDSDSRAGIVVETHSGFPFSVEDEYLQILGHRNSHRFPPYFSAGLSLEREFPLTKKHRVAVRLSAFNLTNHFNPTFVDSNLDSRDFLMFGNPARRSGNIRVRFVKR